MAGIMGDLREGFYFTVEALVESAETAARKTGSSLQEAVRGIGVYVLSCAEHSCLPRPMQANWQVPLLPPDEHYDWKPERTGKCDKAQLSNTWPGYG